MTAQRKLLTMARPGERGRGAGSSPPQDYDALADALRRELRGEVRFDAGSRAAYATDGSNYRQVPIGVVLPRDADDVLATVALCRQFGAPLLPRGGGTSLAGQCCNVAVVLDFSKYMHHVLHIDAPRRLARVQPGAILDALRDAAAPHGLSFGPDPATHSWCTLGGMLGNNSCGIHSQMAGKTVDNTESISLLTYDGLQMTAGWMSEADLEAGVRAGGRLGEIYGGIRSLRDRYAELIRQRYPRIPRRVSGYNLDELLPGADGRFNLARALVGSEGTLATFLEATVRLIAWPRARRLLVLGYPDIYVAADHLGDALQAEPIGLEAIDHMLIAGMKKKNLHPQSLNLLPQGKGWLLVEFGGDSEEEATAKARRLMARLGERAHGPSMALIEDKGDEKRIWEVRESGLGATAFVPGEPVTWEGWEDSAVPPENMGRYLRDLCALYEKYGYRGAFYGHFGQGCLHTRISFDLESGQGIRDFRAFVEEACDLVLRHGGSLSGEHGDGQARAEFLEKMFGPELVQAFRQFKRLWDPDGKMNPGKVVDPYRMDENLRLGPQYKPPAQQTYFQFPADGGSFERAALRCVGVGKCRRLDTNEGSMCPSFQVTREEIHTTRGRAHLLWEMLRGDALHKGWRDEQVKESLDLCLSCKGCKGDCPVNVDIATYKAEFLAHYYEGRLRPRSAYAFALVDRWAQLAALWPGLVNLLSQAPGLSSVGKALAGMPHQRRIPQFATRTFQSWFAERRPGRTAGSRVLLWPDTFTNYFHPEIGQAAVEVLEHAGFAVSVPRGHVCCGRPLYEAGMLARARRYLQRCLEQLSAALPAATPIVVLEPSCASVFRDELHEMLPDDERGRRLRHQVFLLGEFLEQKAGAYRPPRLSGHALLHTHCHQKAVLGASQDHALLQEMGLEVEALPSGCCGMAGSFGFEKEKYEVSVACGERVLLPRVRAAHPSTVVVSDGFSCRQQIAQLTPRRALHLAQVLQRALRKGADSEDGRPPEAALFRERDRDLRGSRRRAGLALAAVTAAAAAFAWAWKRWRR